MFEQRTREEKIEMATDYVNCTGSCGGGYVGDDVLEVCDELIWMYKPDWLGSRISNAYPDWVAEALEKFKNERR